jgi:drug/metabolite transporter (DMT)-like permease
MKSARTLPFLLFCALGIIWGSNFLFMKIALEVITPLQIVWLRVLFGSLPILGFAFLKKSMKWSDFKKAYHFLAMALIANVATYYFFVKGTELLTSGIAGVISGAIPLMTALLAVLTLPMEKLTRRKALGLILGLMGVMSVSHSEFSFSLTIGKELIGAGFILLGSFCIAFGMVYVNKFITPMKMSALSLAAYQTLFASFLLIMVTPTQGIGAIWGQPQALLAIVLGLGLLGTGFAFVMYYFVIDRLGAVTASSVFYIPPVVALLIGAVIRHEAVSLLQALGTLAIIGGIYLVRDEGRPVTKA